MLLSISDPSNFFPSQTSRGWLKPGTDVQDERQSDAQTIKRISYSTVWSPVNCWKRFSILCHRSGWFSVNRSIFCRAAKSASI